MEVLVFKTDVSSLKQVGKVEALLTCFDVIDSWNFDLEDRDNILRIVAHGLSPRHVETVLRKAGIKCKELEG